LRVLVAGQDNQFDVNVDGKLRVKNLKSRTASDYMVLEAGQHIVTLRSAGTAEDRVTATINVERGSAMTVGFPSIKTGVQPILFLDKTNSNKLKSLLTVYHLDSNVGRLNISSADGKTKIFSGLTFGKSASLQVNPISIELAVTSEGDGVIRERPALAMAQGGGYSVFVMADGSQKMVTHVQDSRIEKYIKTK
jgi:alginate O-acetyltransferase complex protein AlgF